MIHPVILCGGYGARLWPSSRKSYPKQFAPLLGRESLYQDTLRRLTGPRFARPLVMTNEALTTQIATFESVGMTRRFDYDRDKDMYTNHVYG